MQRVIVHKNSFVAGYGHDPLFAEKNTNGLPIQLAKIDISSARAYRQREPPVRCQHTATSAPPVFGDLQGLLSVADLTLVDALSYVELVTLW